MSSSEESSDNDYSDDESETSSFDSESSSMSEDEQELLVHPSQHGPLHRKPAVNQIDVEQPLDELNDVPYEDDEDDIYDDDLPADGYDDEYDEEEPYYLEENDTDYNGDEDLD